MSIIYNPNKKRLQFTAEKTDYKTDFKTDYSTDPAKVTKQEKYSYRYGPYGIFTGWAYRTVADTAKIAQNKKLNKQNQKLKEENEALNLKNEKRS